MRRRRRGLVNFVTDIYLDRTDRQIQYSLKTENTPQRSAPAAPFGCGGAWFNIS